MSLKDRMNDFDFEIVSSNEKEKKEKKPEKEMKTLKKDADGILKELGM